MKPSGFLVTIDKLGRIVIPAPLRKTYQLEKFDNVELFNDENGILMRKYQPCCIFCGNAENLRTFKGNNICGDCIKEMSESK
ncbi:MAG: AbrB/MazE/SpoVT family DNA-binding domain-containing protein [Bacillota bacterium]|nr:AbrB/MazE/SpoVT family DNA-binding domain-containing protein [Bacillota bacterium]